MSVTNTSGSTGLGTTPKIGMSTFSNNRPDVPVVVASVISEALAKLDDAAIVVAAPATATSAGSPGQIAYDATHFYVCIASNSWVRATLASW